MSLKIIIFSILLNGSYVKHTIMYNENELISIEEYTIDSDKEFYEKVTYHGFDSDFVKELQNDVFVEKLFSSYQLDSWETNGVNSNNWKRSIEKISKEQLKITKRNNGLLEISLLEKVILNNRMSQLIPMIFKYQGNQYLTSKSETYFGDKVINSTSLEESRNANKEENYIFNSYKSKFENQ